MKIRSQIYKNYQYVAVADIHTCNNRQLRPFSINNNASDTVSAGVLTKCSSRTVRRHRRSCMILRTLFHCPCKTSVALAGLWRASVRIDCYKSPGIRWIGNGGMPCNQDRNQQLQPVFCRTGKLFHRPSYARKQYRSMRLRLCCFCNPPSQSGRRAEILEDRSELQQKGTLLPLFLHIRRFSGAPRLPKRP